MKEFAFEFAEPLTSIFNKSLASGIVPAIWKDSYITHVQKIRQPESEIDIRPTSLASILSKILLRPDRARMGEVFKKPRSAISLYILCKRG
jgi:hypothetical protein